LNIIPAKRFNPSACSKLIVGSPKIAGISQFQSSHIGIAAINANMKITRRIPTIPVRIGLTTWRILKRVNSIFKLYYELIFKIRKKGASMLDK
jgi:hypothetical protein